MFEINVLLAYIDKSSCKYKGWLLLIYHQAISNKFTNPMFKDNKQLRFVVSTHGDGFIFEWQKCLQSSRERKQGVADGVVRNPLET